MKTYQGLTIEEARRLWVYDPEAGVLTWRVDRGANKTAGKVAGCVKTDSCGVKRRHVKLNYKVLMQSILAWGIQTGAWPEDGEIVSFKDKDPLNLKWENLVCDQASAIAGSSRIRSGSASGVRGVYWCKRSKKWLAQICVEGKKYTLGYFKTIEEATLARQAAAKEYFGDFCNEAHEDIDCKAVAEWLESIPKWAGAYGASGVRGVYWYEYGGKWQAKIRVDGKQHSIGYFKTIEEAAAARKAAEEKKDYGGFRSEVQS